MSDRVCAAGCGDIALMAKTKRAGLIAAKAAPAPRKLKPESAKDLDENEVPQEEKDAVSKLLAEIDRAKTLKKDFNEKTLPTLRRLTWGTYKPGNEESTVRTNMIFATQATLLPHIYAKNPEISVAPTEAVSPKEYSQLKEFSATAEIVINKLLVDEAKLKRRMKSGIRSAMSTSVAWFKLSFQHSLTADDPLILRRANDMQDNLQQIEYLIAAADDETDIKVKNQQKEELTQQLQAMITADEVSVFKGFTLDRIRTEDMFILDESIVEFDEYVSARKLSHRVWMTDEDYCKNFRKSEVPKGATKYGQPGSGDVTNEEGGKISLTGSSTDLNVNYRAVHEVWDHDTNMVSVVCEGVKGYCRPPRVMQYSPERWLPFYCLGFNLVEGRWRPLSDVELLQHLQAEYNTTRYLYAEARKEAIPVRIFRKGGGLTEDDITNLVKRRARDFMGVEGNPTVPISNDIMQLEGIKIDPAAYDVTIIRNDMDMMVGLSDASRSNLIQAKTATEADIMQQSLMNRVAERQDTVEDLIGEMAEAVLQVALQAFTTKEITQLIGAGAKWKDSLAPAAQTPIGAPPAQPALDPKTQRPAPPATAVDLDTIFRKVRVSIKAGSTGKPNQTKDRETWAKIMPVLQEMMVKVAELRAAGQFDLAESCVELVKETLSRYDEKIDVDRFIPPPQMGPDGKPVQQQNGAQAAQQAQEQAQEQLQEMQKQLQQCQAELQQCQMDLKVAKQAEQARVAEAEAAKAVDVARETSKAQRDERLLIQKHEKDMQAADNKAHVDGQAALASTHSERVKAEASLRQAALNAAISAASSIISQRLAPKPGKEGEPDHPGEDLTPEEIGDAIATIVQRVVAVTPVVMSEQPILEDTPL